MLSPRRVALVGLVCASVASAFVPRGGFGLSPTARQSAFASCGVRSGTLSQRSTAFGRSRRFTGRPGAASRTTPPATPRQPTRTFANSGDQGEGSGQDTGGGGGGGGGGGDGLVDQVRSWLADEELRDELKLYATTVCPCSAPVATITRRTHAPRASLISGRGRRLK